MSIIDRFFKRISNLISGPQIELLLLMGHFNRLAAGLDGRTIELPLLRARIADGYRNAKIDPVDPQEFDRLTAGLSNADLQRMALAATAFDLPEVINILPLLVDNNSVTKQVQDAFIEFSRAVPLLTIEVIKQSPVRVEEFSRLFILALRAQVAGETPEQSQARLKRIDYARLCAEAEKAKLTAEERVKYLRKLQEEQDKRFAPRGKW